MRAVNMSWRVMRQRSAALACCFIQPAQNAAFSSALAAGALQAQRAQFFSQCSQFANALGHVTHMRVQQGIDACAVGLRRILEPQQRRDFIQRHIQ